MILLKRISDITIELMSKQKLYINFLTRLEKDDLDFMRKLAATKKISIAELIRRMLKIGLKVNGKKYAN